MKKSSICADDPTAVATGVGIDSAKHAVARSDNSATPPVVVPREKSRTPGLKLFDVFLYPIVTNLSVFGISVAATYLTARGGDRNAAGKLVYGKFGEFFQKRGEWIMSKFKSLGMTHNQADMSKMVFFSFLDGSLMAPVVKLVEDKREDIGCYIDHKLGTRPEDLSVYEKEPKQTWLSVLGGRFATAAIVVPTAVALDKTGLNDTLFTKPGIRTGAWLAKKPAIAKLLGTLDVKELSRIGFFEAFYTSVCTAGLYFSSRAIARVTGSKKHHDPEPVSEETPSIPQTVVTVDNNAHCSYSETSSSYTKKHDELKRPRLTETPSSYREKYVAGSTHSPSLMSV